ncbi:MAG: hypothetical protein GWP08_15575 [Nitrospiraceae bacterium]|nr:hypothetical protein [Nitrospiraceae bacterium]
MPTECYQLLILGHISKDIIITPDDEASMVGGAVVYSTIAAHQIGCKLAAVTKLHPDDRAALEVFEKHGCPFYALDSRETTSIRNTYHTADRERRTCEAIAIADPFCIADVPKGVEADVYYLGGLIQGEFPEELVLDLAKRGKVAVDAQGFLRVSEDGPMHFRDWPTKRDILPHIHYLKTDAAEAEILTGNPDHEEAARTLHDWGSAEVMVTHNAGVLVLADGEIHFAPFTSRDLSGRTGRGDTCFASYCAWRQAHSPQEACQFAAALTSLKMETPGPFTGTIQDVETAILERH